MDKPYVCVACKMRVTEVQAQEGNMNCLSWPDCQGYLEEVDPEILDAEAGHP